MLIEIDIPEGGATHRSLEALRALFPGLTSAVIIESVIEEDFRQGLEDFELLQTYGGGAVEYLEEKQTQAAKLRRAHEKARKKSRNDARHDLAPLKVAA